MKSKEIGKRKHYAERLQSCDPTQMFEDLLKLLENKDDDKDEKEKKQKKNAISKMPVRKFFNNTFDTLLNQAFFKLKIDQEKHQDRNEFFTTEGQIKLIAFHLLDNLPEGEISHNPDMSMDEDDR